MTSTPTTANNTMTKDEEVAFWLHNKLGSHADLWSSFSISSALTQEHLLSIKSILWTLDTLVKVKLLLSFIHIPKRNVTEWETLLKEIIEQCHQDNVGDQWISVISEIMKTFPDKSLFNLDLSDQECEGFSHGIQELRKTVKKNNDTSHLPLESCYLGRSALKVLTGEIPNPPKCFNLIRKAKSARVRQDLLERSAQSSKAKKTAEAAALSNARRLEDDSLSYNSLAMQPTRPSNVGFLKPSPVRGSTSGIIGTSRFNPRRDGFVKLLSLEEEQALNARKRKPQTDDEEHGSGKKSARSKKTTTQTTSNERNNNANTNSANDSPSNITNTPKPTQTPTTDGTESSPTIVSPIAYAPLSHNEMPATPNPMMNSAGNDMLFGLQTIRNENPFVSQMTKPIDNEKVSTTPARLNHKLTNDQIHFVQELFRTSPCLSVSDKDRILSFIAGVRDYPCDGDKSPSNSVVTIKLSEQHEIIEEPNTGEPKNYFVESLFQMNTINGEWKRIKKWRPVNTIN